MASVALDLSPVVSSLLERPFDQPSLDRAYAAVGGHPQAYATALRCAAKKTRDSLAAAYWFAEAARIHESMDDLGGAIALLWRAHSCDRSNPRPRELLAATMMRLSVRAGLAFTFTPAASPDVFSSDHQMDSGPVDTGLRPPAPERRFRDTVPEMLGKDSDYPESERSTDTNMEDGPVTGMVLRATLPSALLLPGSLSEEEELLELQAEDERVDQLLPPPKNPSWESAVVQLTRGSAGEPVLRAVADAALRPPAKSVMPPPPSASRQGSVKVVPTPSVIIAPEPKTPEAPVPLEQKSPEASAPGSVPPAVESEEVLVDADEGMARLDAADEVYAEDQAPPTLRPAGDRLVGGVFEALHGLHFLANVREGAAFVCRTLTEKMRPETTLVHLYDINSGHFLVVGAEGNRAAALVDYPTPEDDAFIAQVMKGDDSVLVQDPQSDPRFARGRWALAEPKRSVLCAPVACNGRQLGLIEVADPADGGSFSEDDRNALMYAASALSRFIDRRGLVLSDEPERSSPGSIAS